jgi:hypothetical protein
MVTKQQRKMVADSAKCKNGKIYEKQQAYSLAHLLPIYLFIYLNRSFSLELAMHNDYNT